jgi:glucose/arabinose dehydrogenase
LGAAFLLPSLALLVAVPGCGDDDPEGTGASGAAGNTGAAGADGGAGPGGSGGSGAAGGGGSGAGGGGIPGDYDCSAPSGAVPPLKLTEVATGLDQPMLIKGAPGDNERLYIVERPGRIRILKRGQVLPDPFVDFSDLVTTAVEHGFLGLAFHPDYAQNGRFFVHYSRTGDGATQIAEYKRDAANPELAAVAGGVLFSADQPYPNHNGGSIEFGADGMLYIFLGDGGSANDPQNRAQNLDEPLGKILRLDVDTFPYTAPAGNLPGGLPEIWDYGVRNPYRSSFDACTGDMYIADVGQGDYEEVDVEPAGMGNKNYGWRLKEGNECFNPQNNCEEGVTLTDPVTVYDHSMGRESITGGYVYRGSAIPGLRGTYFYGDFGSGEIFTFVYSGGAATAETNVSADLDGPLQGNTLNSFGQDNSGEVYVVQISGSIFRIDAE